MSTTCPVCRSEKMGRSPTGDWCNACGWAYPGYACEVCGRQGVNEEHLSPTGAPCRTIEKRPYA